MVWKPRFRPDDLWKSVDTVVLNQFQDNPDQYYTLEELKNILLDREQLLHTWNVVLRLAFGHGIKGKILSSIHKWRNHGYFIISSVERNKGYVYVDPNSPNAPKQWDSKFRANEKREDIPKTERRIDEILFQKCLEKCTDPQVRQLFIRVAETHKIKKKRKEE